MNRTKYLGLSLLTLLCCLTVTAQTTVTKCEYWFDQQFDSRTTVTMQGNAWSSSIDISSLNTGLHSVAFRVADNNGVFSSTLVKNFMLVPGSGTGDNSLKTYEYWIDQKFDERKSGTIPGSGSINIDEDISALNTGFHNIAMRIIDKNGIVSSTLVKNFFLVPGSGTGDNSLKTYEYWIDKKFDERKSGTIPEGGIINIDEDISALNTGLHNIAMRIIDKNGIVSSTLVKIFLIVPGTGTGDNSLQTYEYWIDQKFEERKSGTIPEGGIINIDEDISALNDGLHNIAMRVIDKNGIVSSTLVKVFLIVPGTGTGDNSLQTYEYWIDQKFDERKSGTIPEGGIINIDEDISALNDGLHNIAMRVIDKIGTVSSVIVKNFMKLSQMEGDNELLTYEYWFDNAFEEREIGNVPEGGVVNLDIDIAALPHGIHSFNYLTLDKYGASSPVITKNFFVKKVEGEGKLIAIDYWFNDGPRTRIAIDPAQTSIDKDDIIIPMDGVLPRTISEEYIFDATTKKVVTTETITVGIQVFNDGEVGSEAFIDTLENVTFRIDPLFVALDNEESSTKEAPTGGQMQGFSYQGTVGDSLHWEITGTDVQMAFYDADGQVITPEKKIIDGKEVLVMTMPSETVYVLTYGATEEGEVSIKVAQPIELTIHDATREYGDENPTFSFSTKGAAVSGEVVFTTPAVATSPVGDYTIDLDLTGITNSYVSVKAGTLSITKAMVTITADDIEVHQDEEMPELTWTAEGLKNDELAADVFSVMPVCTTDGKPDSPIGEYIINVSGAEAENYEFTYVAGKLTVSVSTGIATLNADVAPADIYTLEGIKVRRKSEKMDGLSKGFYIVNGRKVYIRRR
ncbi:MAG: hypothetical protein IJ910_07665 [Bacteroidaceae bacterium]|nr:hypothetical protein [Bacteroidaceae bacterium]